MNLLALLKPILIDVTKLRQYKIKDNKLLFKQFVIFKYGPMC
jgi:hypothetical protein